MPTKAVIDTNSLLSLARYYLPNDKNQVLHDFIKQKLVSGELIILDKVFKCENLKAEDEECLLITEESMFSNDRKPFHKIPKICKILNIDCCNIQEYFDRMEEIKIEIR